MTSIYVLHYELQPPPQPQQQPPHPAMGRPLPRVLKRGKREGCVALGMAHHDALDVGRSHVAASPCAL